VCALHRMNMEIDTTNGGMEVVTQF
jgi:hypothetical protein